MEVQLTFDQEAKLTRMATEQGRAAETLVQEAVERFLNYDEWFSREVDKGLAAADRGEFYRTWRYPQNDRQPGILLNAGSLDAARCGRSFAHLRLHRRTFRRGAHNHNLNTGKGRCSEWSWHLKHCVAVIVPSLETRAEIEIREADFDQSLFSRRLHVCLERL
jgi:predicted transcriptional regulator